MFILAILIRGSAFSAAAFHYSHMDDAEIMARWDMARHNLLNMLLEFHNQWNMAFAVSHNCGHLRTPNPHKCAASLEKAWASIDDLESLFGRYKKTIGEMRDLAREMSVRGP